MSNWKDFGSNRTHFGTILKQLTEIKLGNLMCIKDRTYYSNQRSMCLDNRIKRLEDNNSN